MEAQALSRAAVREIERLAQSEFGIPGAVLMENAGRGVAEVARELCGRRGALRVAILCGPGNNGGDGYVAARHLDALGILVELWSSVPAERLAGDAAWARGVVERMGLTTTLVRDAAEVARAARAWAQAGLLIDALLGTGATGAPRGRVRELIQAANASGVPILAVDLPSGLDADTGVVAEPCIRAECTVTFVAPKIGFAAPAARAVLGEVRVVGIGAPRALVERVSAAGPGSNAGGAGA
jgi:NAD(P)H-hydrate epimerase